MIETIKTLYTRLQQFLPRLATWWLIAIGLTVAIGLIQPQLLFVALFKLSVAVPAGVLGYLFDRAVFPYARPSDFVLWTGIQDERPYVAEKDAALLAQCMTRRAIIIAAFVIGICLGA
jgi:hypothetical protein